MLRHATVAPAIAAFLACGAANAGTLSYSNVSYYTDNYVTVQDPSGTTSHIQNGEGTYATPIDLTGVQLNNSPASNISAFCMDINDYLITPSGSFTTASYTSQYSSVQSPLTAATANALGYLVSTYTTTADNQTSAATQIAIWAIEYGNGAITYTPGGTTLKDGAFTITGDASLLAAAVSEINAATTAETGGTNYTGNIELLEAPTPGSNQNLLFLVASTPGLDFSDPANAPEPASLAVLGFGLVGLAAVKKRRSAARVA